MIAIMAITNLTADENVAHEAEGHTYQLEGLILPIGLIFIIFYMMCCFGSWKVGENEHCQYEEEDATKVESVRSEDAPLEE